MDASGTYYVSDTLNFVVRRLNGSTGVFNIVAGRLGVSGSSGSGVPGTSALLAAPKGLTLLSTGDLVITDSNGPAIRLLSSNLTIVTLAGILGLAGYAGNNGPGEAFQQCSVSCRDYCKTLTVAAGTSARLSLPYSTSVDPSGLGLYIVRCSS